jgi:hypothetical protein
LRAEVWVVGCSVAAHAAPGKEAAMYIGIGAIVVIVIIVLVVLMLRR